MLPICPMCMGYLLIHKNNDKYRKCITCGYCKEIRLMSTDWTDPTSIVTEHFTVNDCLMLHSWNRLATEADGANFDKLLVLCQVLEKVRDILNCPMNIHCMYRSPKYNL